MRRLTLILLFLVFGTAVFRWQRWRRRSCGLPAVAAGERGLSVSGLAFAAEVVTAVTAEAMAMVATAIADMWRIWRRLGVSGWDTTLLMATGMIPTIPPMPIAYSPYAYEVHIPHTGIPTILLRIPTMAAWVLQSSAAAGDDLAGGRRNAPERRISKTILVGI